VTAQCRQRNIDIWEAIYSKNENLLAYPDDVLVRISYRLLEKDKHKKLLDYGFGGASNLIHFAKQGYQVSGVEVSESAIHLASKRCEDMGVQAQLRSVKDGNIPFPDQYFDVVVAWQVLLYNDWTTFPNAMAEIDRVLKPGGLFIGTMGAVGDYSHTHSKSLGNSLFESTVPNQTGAVMMLLEEHQLQDCFPGREIKTGQFGYEFEDRHGLHWIVSYVK